MMRLCLLIFLLFFSSPCLAAPKVVVSIAPIHSLVSALTSGITEPVLLLPQGGSPHSASLRPSQARALASADLLIWIGPELESFLQVPIERLVDKQAVMRLLALKQLDLLPQRQGGFWETDDHDHDHAGEEDHSPNPHIWLSPQTAQQISAAISARLMTLDPQNRAVYQKNLAQLTLRIQQLEEELNLRLQAVRQRPYLVFHDAYPYFEKTFALNAVGSIRVSADRAPGARRLQQIRDKISDSSAICLFSEPQFSPALARQLAAGSELKLGELDPLGSQAVTGEDGWFILLNELTNNLLNCLTEKTP